MLAKKTFKRYYILSAVTAFVAIAVFIILVGLSINDATSRPKGGSLDMPGSGTISLEDDGDWMVYFEYESELSEDQKNQIRVIDIQIKDQNNMEDIYLDPEIIGAGYIKDGIQGVAEYEISIETPTTVFVETTYKDGDGPDFRVNITRDSTTTILIGIGFGVLISIVIFLAAFVFLIIAVVKHSNFNKQQKGNQESNLPEY